MKRLLFAIILGMFLVNAFANTNTIIDVRTISVSSVSYSDPFEYDETFSQLCVLDLCCPYFSRDYQTASNRIKVSLGRDELEGLLFHQFGQRLSSVSTDLYEVLDVPVNEYFNVTWSSTGIDFGNYSYGSGYLGPVLIGEYTIRFIIVY